jgi:hypothetical protein
MRRASVDCGESGISGRRVIGVALLVSLADIRHMEKLRRPLLRLLPSPVVPPRRRLAGMPRQALRSREISTSVEKVADEGSPQVRGKSGHAYLWRSDSNDALQVLRC